VSLNGDNTLVNDGDRQRFCSTRGRREGVRHDRIDDRVAGV
jgi:hypothetical protein